MYSTYSLYNYFIFEHLEEYSYEIFNEYDENGQLLEDHDIVRRDTQERNPTNRPGMETEQRPFFPRNPPTTRLPPTLTLNTKPSPKQTAGRTANTSVTEGSAVTNSSTSATTRNYTYTINVSIFRLSLQ